MTAPVRIDAAAWGDLRFATLARLCGFADAEHALIKCAKIWSWQTEHYTEDQPTYVVELDIVESALGPGSAAHLVRARLAEEGPDGLRIRGSEGRIEWLFKQRSSSKLGGEATRRKHANKRGPTAQPVAMPAARPMPGPKVGPIEGPLTPDLSPDQISDHTHSRVRERHPAVGGIARAVWNYAAQVRVELAGGNLDVPPWALMPGTEHSGWIALLDRVGERLVDSTAEQAEQVCRNRVDVAAAKARADGDGSWFASTSLFTRKSFDSFADLDPKSFGRKPPKNTRAPGALIGASTPHATYPDNPNPIDWKELDG